MAMIVAQYIKLVKSQYGLADFVTVVFDGFEPEPLTPDVVCNLDTVIIEDQQIDIRGQPAQQGTVHMSAVFHFTSRWQSDCSSPHRRRH